MGTGTNVQKRLVAIHHLDTPWKPAEVEQRDGRILRPGQRKQRGRHLSLRHRRVLRCLYVAGVGTKARFIGHYVVAFVMWRPPTFSEDLNPWSALTPHKFASCQAKRTR